MDRIYRSPVKYGALFGAGVVLVMALIGFLRWWNTPLGTELALATGTPPRKTSPPPPPETLIPGTQQAESEVSSSGRETPAAETPTPTPTPAAETARTPEPMCGGPDTLYLLVTGVDSGNYIYGLSDAIRIIRVDFVEGKVTVLPLPRDLYVSISVQVPGLDQSYVQGKLNQAYFYGSPGMGYYDQPDGGPGLLARTLGENFNLRVDRYLSVNTRIFRRMVEEVGGVNVYLPENVYGHHFNEPVLYLEAGQHHLTGKQAEMVARHRTLIGDFGRVKNQTILLKAFVRKLLTPQGIKEVPALIDIYREDVLMDFTPNQISKLLCLAGKIDLGEDITFLNFPQEILTEGRVYAEANQAEVYALTYDQEQVRQLLADFQAGDWP